MGLVLIWPDGRDAGEGQEEPKMVAEAGIVAGDHLAGGDLLRLQDDAVRRENELGLRRGRLGALAQEPKRLADRTGRADSQVDVVGLKHPARHVGRVAGPSAKPPNGRLLVAERLKEREGKLGQVERRARQRRHDLIDSTAFT